MIKIAINLCSSKRKILNFLPLFYKQTTGISYGTYRIKTCGHSICGQPPGWELSAWRFPSYGDIRNGGSSFVAVHEPGKWGSDWTIGPGSRPGTYRIKTCGHSEGMQPPGWELTAWRSEYTNKCSRNGGSTYVAMYATDTADGTKWGSDWELQKIR